MTRCFKSISKVDSNYPAWFTGGKKSLIPKEGNFTSDNQRPITCLNTIYKWFTSCMLRPMDEHLNRYELMEKQQRGATEGCSGTTDNLHVDRMVTQDCHRGRRNLSMAWIDITKAYDSVDHYWLCEMMVVHRFPIWIRKVLTKLYNSWNTKIVTTTKIRPEVSDVIHFNRGFPQGDSLCPRLFTICLNHVAWKLNATEGYRLSKPMSTKVTHILYIDDLKVFAASTQKLNIGLEWNPKKCSVVNIKRGVKVANEQGMTSIGASFRSRDCGIFVGVPGYYTNQH